MSDRALRQALRRRYRGHEGRLLRKRSRELQRAGDRNVSELRAQRRQPAERTHSQLAPPGAGEGQLAWGYHT